MYPLRDRTFAAWSIRVLLGEDNLLVREGLRSLLAGSPSIDPWSTLPATTNRCSRSATSDPPNVVVTDIRMPPTQTDEGIRLADELRVRPP